MIKSLNDIPSSVKKFMPLNQQIALLKSDEHDDVLKKLADRIEKMPKSYETDGQGKNAIAYLHYFKGGTHVFITEKDKEDEQLQAYGLTVLNRDWIYAEMGYVSIDELKKHDFELDLFWTPVSIKEIRDNEDKFAFGGELSVEQKLEIDRAFEYLQEYLPKNNFEKLSKISASERKENKIKPYLKYKIEELDEKGDLKSDSDIISSYVSVDGMVDMAYKNGMKRISYLTDEQKSNIIAAYDYIKKNGAKSIPEKTFVSELGYQRKGTQSNYVFSDRGLEEAYERFFKDFPTELKNLTLKFKSGESVYLKDMPDMNGIVGFKNQANGTWYVKFKDGSDGFFSEEDLINVDNKKTILKNGGKMENNESEYALNSVIEFGATDRGTSVPKLDLQKTIGSDDFDLIENELIDERDGTYSAIIKSSSIKFEGLKGSRLEEVIYDELSNGLWNYDVTISNVRFIKDLEEAPITEDKFDDGGLINVQDITADPAQPLEKQEIQNADIGSMQYIPKSIVCETVDTVAPAAMLYEMNRSLTEIDRAVRGIDAYVMKKLGYDNLIDMCRAFSSEQVDAIANAIYQIEQGQALIVGDMTGVGKGRIAAGVMRYAINIGKVPIFFTEKPNLFSDIYRDLIAIGSDDGVPIWFKGKEIDKIKHVTRKLIEDSIKEDIENGDFDLDYNLKKLFTKGYEKDTNDCIEEYRELYFPSEIIKEVSYTKNEDYKKQIKNANRVVPFIVNGRSSKTEIKDGDGNVIYEGLSNIKPEYALKTTFASGKLPKEFNSIMLTYSQVNSPSRAKEKIDWLLKLAKNNIVIMDESHNASGSSQTGAFLQGLLQETAGVCFLSATFAKRPDNMPIYAMKTSIQDAEMDNSTLIEAIMSGGVALQEILSSELVSEGQMLRRERSYEGVVVNYNYLDERMLERDVPLPNFNLKEPHEAISDTVTDIIRRIILFQKQKVNPIIEQKDKEYAKEQIKAGVDKQNIEGGISNPPMFSGIFNLINQLLFSIKADAVAEFAITRMKEGKKVIIGFSSTLESFLDYLIQDESDKIKTDFSIILKRRLEKTLEYKTTFPNGDVEKRALNPNEYPTITDEYYSILNDIQNAATGITISPIDAIVSKIKKAGYKVGEVTGRKKQVEFFDDGVHGAIKSRRKDNANDLFRRFNDNELDCLLINQAGATGASAQAIKTKKAYVVNYNEDGTPKIPTSLEPRNEVKQRVMIILQAELDINKEVQKRGRINRTAQIFKPIYDYVISAIPAEERLMMMLQKKLKSLDANTTSNQKQSRKVLDVVDFLNIYGDEKVVEFLKDNPQYNEMIGNILKFNPDNEPSESTEGIYDKAHKVSGRIAILPVELQSNFYKTVSENYQNLETQLRQTGEWNLEVQNMDLEAKTLSKDVVIVGNPEKKSVFGEAVFIEKCSVNNLRKPFKKVEVENLIKSALTFTTPDGDVLKFTPEEKTQFLIKKFLDHVDENKKSQLNYAETRRINALKDLKESPSLDKKKNKEEREAYLFEKTELIETEFTQRVEAIERQSKNIKGLVVGYLEYFTVKRKIAYPLSLFDENKEVVSGICLGIEVNLKNPNPFAPSQMNVRFILPNSMKLVKMPLSDVFIYKIKEAMNVNPNILNASERDVDYFIEDWDIATKESQANRIIRFIVTGNILKGYGNKQFRNGGRLISYTTDSGLVKKGILLHDSFQSDKIKVSIPVNKALNYILGMSSGTSIQLHGEDVTIQKAGQFHILYVKKSKNDFVDIVHDTDISSFAFYDKWDLKKGEYHNRFEEVTIKKLLGILWDKYKMSVSLPVTAFEGIKNQFDIEERERGMHDGTEELIKHHNKMLDEYERSKKFEVIDDKEFKKLDELEKENYELKKSVAELEAIRRAYKITALLDDETRKRKREAMESIGQEQMKRGGSVIDDTKIYFDSINNFFNKFWNGLNDSSREDIVRWIDNNYTFEVDPKDVINNKLTYTYSKFINEFAVAFWNELDEEGRENISRIIKENKYNFENGGSLDSTKRFTDSDYNKLIQSGGFKGNWSGFVWEIYPDGGGKVLGKFNPHKHTLFIFGKKDLSNPLVEWLQKNSYVSADEYIKLADGGVLISEKHPDLKKGQLYTKLIDGTEHSYFIYDIKDGIVTVRIDGINTDKTISEIENIIETENLIPQYLPDRLVNGGGFDEVEDIKIFEDLSNNDNFELTKSKNDLLSFYTHAPKIVEKNENHIPFIDIIGGAFVEYDKSKSNSLMPKGTIKRIFIYEGDVTNKKPLFEIYPNNEYFN